MQRILFSFKFGYTGISQGMVQNRIFEIFTKIYYILLLEGQR